MYKCKLLCIWLFNDVCLSPCIWCLVNYYTFVPLVPHDDVIKWKHFPRYWPFVRGIHRSPVNSPHKGQWRGALVFSFMCVWINGWVNNRKAGDLRRYRAHYDVIVMFAKLYWREPIYLYNIETNSISTPWPLLNLFIVITVMWYVDYVIYASCGMKMIFYLVTS